WPRSNTHPSCGCARGLEPVAAECAACVPDWSHHEMTAGMTRLNEEQTAEFLARFPGDDGVVRSVTVTYPYGWFTKPSPGGKEVTHAVVLLSLQDAHEESRWCNLSLLMQDVQELHVRETDRGYHNILSDGLKIAWFDGLVFVDFSVGHYDLSVVDWFRKANRYVAARELYGRVEPYDR